MFDSCNPMNCSLPSSSVHGDSPGKNTGVGCYFLLQGIFQTQGFNPRLLHLLHWQAESLPLISCSVNAGYYFINFTHIYKSFLKWTHATSLFLCWMAQMDHLIYYPTDFMRKLNDTYLSEFSEQKPGLKPRPLCLEHRPRFHESLPYWLIG